MPHRGAVLIDDQRAEQTAELQKGVPIAALALLGTCKEGHGAPRDLRSARKNPFRYGVDRRPRSQAAEIQRVEWLTRPHLDVRLRAIMRSRWSVRLTVPRS